MGCCQSICRLVRKNCRIFGTLYKKHLLHSPILHNFFDDFIPDIGNYKMKCW
ncbi:hypothetical protein RUMCAL_01532 [Ruminococcus callidus ATCC 27760]|uniref:Uncharacterized protein n=1 Tax=Ruminococcus callidus ATCC 27760 TaxID=411473 RepID=U2KC86_9FIRM|nr:hypothetical protein RUMCAL_01532 [Ruminococcus callidus ATCC 27760]